MARRALLVCGVLASLLYSGMNVFVATQWEGYNSASQTVSELSAIGAPTRSIWVPLGMLYTLLVAAFGLGVWQSGWRSRPLRVAGAVLIAYGVFGLGWPPMHQRAVLAAGGGTLTDTLHLVWAGVTVLLMLLAMGFAAAAFDKRFRLYTIASVALLMACGALTGMDAPRVQADLPTPWVGVWERINIGVFLIWVVALAVALWRVANRSGVTAARSSAFKTPEGESAYLAAYDAAMKAWPEPYEEKDIPSRFGLTHVLVGGPKEAPPLVLLHGYWATLTMWTPNISDLSKHYRVYAIDVMGQPGKSIPDEPIKDAADYAAWLTAILDGLRVDRISLAGMSYGGWLALNYAMATLDRVRKLVLLSPAACLLPLVRQFSLRGMLMVFVPSRLTVDSFMRWMGFAGDATGLMYLGLKHFRIPKETLRVAPAVFADDELRSMHVPTLILIGEREVIYDPAAALARARRLLPKCEGELVPASSHDMTFSQHRIVDARILGFLADDERTARERVVA